MLAVREVDHVNIVTDEYLTREMTSEDDCTQFQSTKTGRGPLCDGWKVNLKDCSNYYSYECQYFYYLGCYSTYYVFV